MAFQITRRLRIVSLSLLALLLAYALAGFWLAPRLLRSQIEDFSLQHWQRKPTLGAIQFNPFTFTLRVEGFDFKDSSNAPLLSFRNLRVNLDISSIWRRGISFREIELDQPAGRILVRPDGSLNLAELSAPFAAKAGNVPEPAGEAARVFIDRLKLSHGLLEFEDHARAAPFKARLTPVNFELLDFSTVGTSDEQGNRYSLQAQSAAGETFQWSGNFALSPLQSRGDFELGNVQARTLWSYLQESVGFEVADGKVGVSGNYVFVASEPALRLDVTLSRVQCDDLKLRARGGDQDWVQLQRLTVADATAQLAARRLDIGRIALDSGTLQVRRDAQGRVNLLALAELPSPAAATPSQSQPAPAESVATPTADPWIVNAPDIRLENVRIDLEDAYVTPAARFVLTPVTLKLNGFSTAPGQTLDLALDLGIEQGGRFSVQAKGVPADRAFTGTLALDDLNLAAFQPYVGTYTQMTLLGGTLSAKLEADYKPGGHRISGQLSSGKLRTVDNALRENFIQWDRLALTGIEYRSNPASLRIADVDARAPYLRLIIAPDQTTNLSRVLARPESAPGPVQTVSGTGQDPVGTASPMALSIGRVRVENGSANFADFWITPNYAVSLQQLGGAISGLSSRKDSRARVALTGKIDRYAPVQIAGELNLLSASLFTDLRVKFDGVELTSVTPYSGRFAGYRIEKGKLSVDVRYKVENRKLDAEQRFVVDQLTLGERVDSPDAVKLPLRLAVALLKDRNGVIDLPLPVSGSLDDPQFKIGPIVWKAFVNLLAGIATSPFKLLGGMFGGGEEVNLIDFAPGSASLDAAATGKLASLTKALIERPQLALEVPAAYAPDADLAVLAASQLEAKLTALAQARKVDTEFLADPARRFELLLALYRADASAAALPPGAQALQALKATQREAAALAAANAELEAALRPGIDALEGSLQTLAQARARAIQDALLSSGEIDPARVFMLAAVARPASADRIRIALSLK